MCSAPAVQLTCSKRCHELFIIECIQKYGLFKKITDSTTNISYKIPTRIIIEEGINQKDLHYYPVWE